TTDMLATSMNLAAGTMTDLSTVTDGLGVALKMFDANSSEATRYSDILARAQAGAATDTAQLFEGISAAGPMFKTVAWDIGDLATAVGIFGDAGISASEGMTAMNSGLTRLASPRAKGALALKQYGIEAFDATGKMKSFVEIQELLHDAFKDMSAQEKITAADAIFGLHQGAKWLNLIEAAPSRVKELNSEIENGNKTAKDFAEALMTPMEKLKSAFDVMQNGIGKQLNPALEPVLTKITDIINAFNRMGDEGQQRIIRIAAAAAATGPALIIVGKLTIGFSKLLGAMSVIGKAGGVVQAALGGIAATPVIAGIAAVVGVVALLATHWDKAKETMSQFQWVFNGLSKNFEQFQTSISPVTAALSEFAKAVWDCLGDSLATVVGGAVTVFAGFLSTVLGVANGVIGAIGRMKDFVNEAFEAIANSPVGKAASAISSVLGAAASAGGAHSGGIGKNAAGTSSWRGGLTMVHEKGGEIMDLPQGTRIYPAERSANMMRTAGVTISIPKLADQLVIREDADIDRLVLFPGVGQGEYSIEYSRDAEGWRPLTGFTQDHV
ncbi:MAG: phage tail tape measure protein, partial [Selenomonas sp.]|nr:phage tail tape measure protein [Selenomonas sp.]